MFSFSFLCGLSDVQSLLNSGVWTASLTGNMVQMGLDITNRNEILLKYKRPWWFYLFCLISNITGGAFYLFLSRTLAIKRPAPWCALQFLCFEVVQVFLQNLYQAQETVFSQQVSAHEYGPEPWHAVLMCFSFGTMNGFTMDGPLACRVAMCSGHLWRLPVLIFGPYYMTEPPMEDYTHPEDPRKVVVLIQDEREWHFIFLQE